MAKRKIIDVENYPIRPEHINTKARHFWDAFGNHEKEISAWWIVAFCQKQGSWLEFSLEQLEAFYNEHGHKGF